MNKIDRVLNAMDEDRIEIDRLTAILDGALNWWNANEELGQTRIPPWVLDARVALGRKR